jgi:hypothetical protein
VFGGVVAAVNCFCDDHGQQLAIVMDEREFPVSATERERLPWLPASAALNSFAIIVEK